MSKDYATSPIKKEYLTCAFMNKKNLDPKLPSLKLGQEFHTTGKLAVKITDTSEGKFCWVGLETLEGTFIPIKWVMNISSMNGYYTTGEYISEYIEGKIKKIRKHRAMVVEDFNFSKVFQPSVRGLLSFIEDADLSGFFNGKIIRYLGIVVRPYEAKKDSPRTSADTYKAGMKRVTENRLWEVRLTPEEQRKKEQAEIAERLRIQREEEQALLRKAEAERRERQEAMRREKANYNQRNSHWRDSNLYFNSINHTYTVGEIQLQSVTDFVEHCFPEFNSREMACRVAARSGQSVAEVLSMWERKGKESRDAGTEMHHKIESFYQLKNITDDDTFRLFRIFANRIILNPYRTEWPVYDIATNLAGTIDFVDYSNGKYIIYDWKRSDKLIENGLPIITSKYDQKALPPIDHVDDCPYNRYALQLSLYKYILEKNYGIEISELRLGVFHPVYNKPYVLKMPYLKNEIETLMLLRESIIL